MIKHTALTIAGSDSSGGAGIQADLKAMLSCGVFGMSAITAITAQNTMGVKSIMQVSPDILADQLDMIFTDIFPEAVKVGMTFNCDLIEVISAKLSEYKAKNIVVDPVATGTLCADPINLPFNDGITRPIALAAPVELGTMFVAAALALLRFPFLCGPSSTI